MTSEHTDEWADKFMVHEQPSEYVEREAEDIEQMITAHMKYPPDVMDTRAREMYDSLREANQWLPSPDQVAAHEDLTLGFGVGRMATLTLTVFINLPEDFHDRAEA